MAADRGMGPPRPAEAKRNLARVLKLAKKLPGVEEGVTHGSRDIRANGKSLGAIRADADFSLNCASRNAKDFLLETQGDVFWQAPHYFNSTWCIVRVDKASDQQLFTALEASWLARAPKKIAAAYLEKTGGKPAKIAPAKAPAKNPRAKSAATSASPKDHFARVVKIASKLPRIEVSTSYGTPSIKANKKFLCRIKEGTDGESLVIIAGNADEKEFMLESDPKAFWQTPHYEGHNGLLVHLSKIDDKRLFNLLEADWKRKANKKMLAEYEANRG